MAKEFICNHKYLVLTASFYAHKKRLLFYMDDKLVFDLVVSLDYENPDYEFSVNMERFMGKNIKVFCDEDIDIKFDLTDEVSMDYSGKYRPYIHFTSKRGWINDPNGLVYHNGKYLMYYQHNPVATTWENMHWGSASSEDLIHWEENGDVLFPDEYGTIFSGSGMIDKKNVSGLGKEGKELPLFFYTCAGNTSEASKGQPFTQNLAYSYDGGRTLLRYDKPLIKQIAEGNRDPKVIYYEPDDSYILAMFLEGHEFALFKSHNLLDWEELQRITLPDDAECPDFYPLSIDGETKWIFCAASDRYYIGSFDGKKYTPETEQLQLNYGNSSYASQSWSDEPHGRRIRTSFASIVIPGMPFGNCMNIPQDMSLKYVNGKLRLCATPVKEIEKLYMDQKIYENIRVDDDHLYSVKVDSKACDIRLQIKCKGDFKMKLFGLSIEYDGTQSLLKCGEQKAVVEKMDDMIELRVIYDTIYGEIYAAGGSVFMGIAYFQDTSLCKLTITSKQAMIKELSVALMGKFY